MQFILIVVYVIAFTLLDDYFLMLDDETSLFIMLTGLFVLHFSLNYYFLVHKVKANL